MPLPEHVERILAEFVVRAAECLGDNLRSITLFGSAAEGRMRRTSDVNVLVVLRSFDSAAAAAVADKIAFARAAIRMRCMFVLESELSSCAELFALKFSDVRRRHRVLHGTDPWPDLDIPRAAQIPQLRQVALNQAIRLRGELALGHGRPAGLALSLSEAAGPLRAAAALLLELEGSPANSPREALAIVAKRFLGERGAAFVQSLSSVRETLVASSELGTAQISDAIVILKMLGERARELEGSA